MLHPDMLACRTKALSLLKASVSIKTDYDALNNGLLFLVLIGQSFIGFKVQQVHLLMSQQKSSKYGSDIIMLCLH